MGNHIRTFDWYQNQRPWELTLNGYYALCCITHMSFGAHHKKWMKIDPYYQQQKCSPGIAVSSKTRFMWIFGGVRWRGGFKWEWGPRKWRFSLILPAISHLRPQLLYYAICSPIVALQWHRNRWPWMTLNAHFALKSVSGSATNELAFSDKTVRNFEELPILLNFLVQWQTADRKNSQYFNRIVHRRLWAKVHKIFHTCIAPRGLFTVKVCGGLQQKILRESPKTGNFCTCTCKSAHCVYLGGQRSRSNVYLVGHCLMVPQPF